MRIDRVEHSVIQIFDSRDRQGVVPLIIRYSRVNLEGNEGKTSAPPRVFISHYGNINHVSDPLEVVFDVVFSSGIHNSTDEVLDVNRVGLDVLLLVLRKLASSNWLLKIISEGLADCLDCHICLLSH